MTGYAKKWFNEYDLEGRTLVHREVDVDVVVAPRGDFDREGKLGGRTAEGGLDLAAHEGHGLRLAGERLGIVAAGGGPACRQDIVAGNEVDVVGLRAGSGVRDGGGGTAGSCAPAGTVGLARSSEQVVRTAGLRGDLDIDGSDGVITVAGNDPNGRRYARR